MVYFEVRDTGIGIDRPTRRGCSSPSPRRTPPPPAATAAPAWAWPSAAGSPRPWAARSASTARPAEGSTFWFDPAAGGAAVDRSRAGAPASSPDCGSWWSTTTPPTGWSWNPSCAAGSCSRRRFRTPRRPWPGHARQQPPGRRSTSPSWTCCMPDIDGLALAREIKADAGLADIRADHAHLHHAGQRRRDRRRRGPRMADEAGPQLRVLQPPGTPDVPP